MGKEFVAEGLFKELKPHLKNCETVLNPTSSLARDYLKENIEALGLSFDKVNIYNTVKGELKNKKAFEEVDIILYTSPSTVKNMIEIIGLEKIKEKKNIAIGPITLKELQKNNIEALSCKKHSEEGFLEEIIKFKELI